jgi:hypothetical protein
VTTNQRKLNSGPVTTQFSAPRWPAMAPIRCLQISERKFQSEDIVADLCLGAAIAGVNTLIRIAIIILI